MALDDNYSVDWEAPESTGADVEEVTSGIESTFAGTEEEQKSIAEGAASSTQPAYDVATAQEATDTYATMPDPDESVSELSTVSGQLQQILDPESELMMQAKSVGQSSAANLGQLGSTAGIRAAQGAVYDKATEIAAADASTYAQAGRITQQGKVNQAQTTTDAIAAGGLAQQEAAINQKQQALNNAYSAAIKSADQQTAAILSDQQNKWNESMKQMELDFNEWSTNAQIDATTKENLLNRMAEAQLNHQIVTQELLGDPSFLELGGAAIANLMDTMALGVSASIKSDFVAAGYAKNDTSLNNMLNDWTASMKLINYSGIK